MVADTSLVGLRAHADELLTRERLVLTGVRAFSASGFDGVSVREIERQAGVNRGVVGYHFGSKEQLWKSCIEWLMESCHAEMQRYSDLLSVVSGPERRRVLLTAFVEFVARRPEFFRMIVIDGMYPSERTAWAVDGLRETLRFFDEASGRPRAAPEQDAAAAYMFLGAASMVFAVPAQCRYLFGFDPAEPSFVGGFSRTVAGLGVLEPPDGTGP
ncbi:MAG TPA: TetR/AcrR family transcriptional regulator [Pseudonocardia sp.]|jgi:AcrR family transcriptional regulator|nr:TetR/AcrR family transcriptional regulator [Pseudonocardia sp.]